jgi:hypothetical protein
MFQVAHRWDDYFEDISRSSIEAGHRSDTGRTSAANFALV